MGCTATALKTTHPRGAYFALAAAALFGASAPLAKVLLTSIPPQMLFTAQPRRRFHRITRLVRFQRELRSAHRAWNGRDRCWKRDVDVAGRGGLGRSPRTAFDRRSVALLGDGPQPHTEGFPRRPRSSR